MKPRDTPLIRPSERRNANAWFYGVGAALAILTLIFLLLGIPGPNTGETSAPPPVAEGQ